MVDDGVWRARRAKSNHSLEYGGNAPDSVANALGVILEIGTLNNGWSVRGGIQ